MFKENELVRRVKGELRRDSAIDAEAIAVAGSDGRVTLRGTVGSDGEKRAVGKAVGSVFGVVFVDNGLEVAVLNARTREDAELRADVLDAFMAGTAVPPSVEVKVEDGLVTLTGTADWEYQRDAAQEVAGMASGARVINDIALVDPTPPEAADVRLAP